MRDLYQELGLDSSASDMDIRFALGRNNNHELRKTASHILLEERRKRIYDKNLKVLKKIGLLRTRLGTENSWFAQSQYEACFPENKTRVFILDDLQKKGVLNNSTGSKKLSKKSIFDYWWVLILVYLVANPFIKSSKNNSNIKTPSITSQQNNFNKTSPSLDNSHGLKVVLPEEAIESPKRDLDKIDVQKPLPPPKKQIIEKWFSKGIAPLEIVTKNSKSNFFVKIIDISSQKPILIIFIKGGQSFKTHIPTGTYAMKYATGEKWYGKKFLFGSKTQYFKTDKNFDFSMDQKGVKGYYIELFLQPHGNLQAISIDPSNF